MRKFVTLTLILNVKVFNLKSLNLLSHHNLFPIENRIKETTQMKRGHAVCETDEKSRKNQFEYHLLLKI